MANPSDLRARLVRALEADVIGPFDPETGEEVLRLPPSRWYLTGFLAPRADASRWSSRTPPRALGHPPELAFFAQGEVS